MNECKLMRCFKACSFSDDHGYRTGEFNDSGDCCSELKGKLSCNSHPNERIPFDIFFMPSTGKIQGMYGELKFVDKIRKGVGGKLLHHNPRW